MELPQNPFQYASVCSGIEAVSVAWHPLEMTPVWFSEIEPFPCAVLAHHYPQVPNHGDMTLLANQVLDEAVSAPPILIGGTPCQDFSVAGFRAGLAAPRGALSLNFVELANAIDQVRIVRNEPEAVIVWENVPGVLSDKRNAFLQHWLAKTANFIPQGKHGRTRVLCLAPKEQSRGGSWMPNISAFPNDAVVCFLSQVLEQGLIPPRYFLSQKARAGILRRTERRKRILPPLLEQALKQ